MTLFGFQSGNNWFVDKAWKLLVNIVIFVIYVPLNTLMLNGMYKYDGCAFVTAIEILFVSLYFVWTANILMV